MKREKFESSKSFIGQVDQHTYNPCIGFDFDFDFDVLSKILVACDD